MSEHPNATRAREGFERFVLGDVPALLDLFADDAVWRVPGSKALSGSTRAAMRSSRSCVAPPSSPAGRTASSSSGSSPTTATLSAVYRARGSAAGRATLDIEQALLVELEGGRWKVVRAQPLDQAAFDAFWNV